MLHLKTCLLGDLIRFQRGFDLPVDEMKEGSVPVIGSNGIIGFHNVSTTKGPVITVGRSGNIGNPRITYEDSWCHNTTLFIKEYYDCDPIFMYYFLQLFDFKNYSGGSAVPTLNRNHIHNMFCHHLLQLVFLNQIYFIIRFAFYMPSYYLFYQ